MHATYTAGYRTGQQHIRGVALALGAATFFSIKAIFVKLAYRYGVDALTLLTLRMLFALPFFAVLAWIEARKAGCSRITAKQGRSILWLGLIGYYLASLFDFLGLQYVSAGLERLVLFLFPTLTVLISAVWLGRAISRFEVMALLLSYVGIVMAVGQEVSLAGDGVVLGAVLVFAGTFAYAIYLVGSGELIPKLGARRFMALAMIVSCLAVVMQYLMLRDPAALLELPMAVYGYALAIAVISTVLPAFMLAGAMGRIGAARTSIIGGVGPVVTIVLAALLLGETMGTMQQLGALLVVAGVLLPGLVRR